MIRLEYFDENDFEALIEWINDEYTLSNWAGTMFSFPLTRDKLTWYLEDSNNFLESDALNYKAVDVASGEMVGHISLTAINRNNRSARITRMLVNPNKRGNGLCCNVVKELMRIGFVDLDLHRVSLGVYDFNDSAIKCYLRAGFKTDGILRDISRQGDRYWSLMEMSILEDEWRATNPPL